MDSVRLFFPWIRDFVKPTSLRSSSLFFAPDVVLLPLLNSPSCRDVRHVVLVEHVYEGYCVRSLTIMANVSRGASSQKNAGRPVKCPIVTTNGNKIQ